MRLIVIFLFVCLNAVADNFYVDNEATGSNNGTSWANAWESFGDVQWGSGAGQVGAGDTLFISGGSSSKTYTSSGTTIILNVPAVASGTTNNRVTIRVGQDAGHNGVVIFDAQTTLQAWAIRSDASYCTLDGEYNGTRHWIVTNGNWADQYTGVGNLGADPMVRYLDVVHWRSGIDCGGVGNGRIEYCYLHDMGGDRAISVVDATHVPGWNHFFINNCDIQLNMLDTESGMGPDGIQGCNGLTVYSNHFWTAVGSQTGPNHSDMIQAEALWVTVYANVFENTVESWFDVDGEQNGTNGHFRIYNNIFKSTSNTIPKRHLMRWYGPGSTILWYDDIWIVNNTFVDAAYGAASGTPCHAIQFSGNTGVVQATNVHILNNLIYNCARSGLDDAILVEASSGYVQGNWDINFNLVNAGAHGSAGISVDDAAFTQANGQTGVPTFVSYIEGSTNNNFRLATNDVTCIGQGTNLTSLGLFTTDFDGNTRTNSGPWDIGAFVVGASGGETPPETPAAPANFYATNCVIGRIEIR